MTKTETIRILLTGASGFLGQHILHKLATTTGCPSADDSSNTSTNYHVHALYRSLDGFASAAEQLSNENLTVETYSLDLTDATEIDAWMMKQQKQLTAAAGHGDQPLAAMWDVCIHTAALSDIRVCQNDPQQAVAVNNPHYFFQALYRHNPNLLLIALSTDHVYAGQPPVERGFYIETDQPGPCNSYGQSKLAMEQYLTTTSSFKENTILLRSSIILGPKAPLVPEKVHATFLHFIATRDGHDTDFFTDEKRNVIAAADVEECIVWFVRHHCYSNRQQHTKNNMSSSSSSAVSSSSYAGVYNLGGPESLSRMDMAMAVFECLGYDQKHLVAKTKADLPVNPEAPSPLDLSMDSSKVQAITGLSFRPLPQIVKSVFSRKES